MVKSEPLSYSLIEIRSFLPTGWSIAASEPGEWDADAEAWVVTLRDGSDLEWPMKVSLKKARSEGRLQALEQAAHDLSTRRRGGWLG